MCAPSLSIQLKLCVPNKRSDDYPKSSTPTNGVLPYLNMMRRQDDSSTDSGISKGILKITIFGIILSRYDIYGRNPRTYCIKLQYIPIFQLQFLLSVHLRKMTKKRPNPGVTAPTKTHHLQLKIQAHNFWRF